MNILRWVMCDGWREAVMTSPDDNYVNVALDENSRRYYLDAMGVQCWQLLDSKQAPEVVEQNSAGNLHKTQQQEILPRGNESAKMMFVLLSPSRGDENTGELCSGEEGELLTKMLAAINISIADVYITSLLKYSQPADSIISENEIAQCHIRLKKQVEKVKPKVLIVLGETTAQYLLKQNTSLDVLRDKINLSNVNNNKFESTPLFVSYSPTELLQKEENKRKAWSDLQQLQKLSQTFFSESVSEVN